MNEPTRDVLNGIFRFVAGAWVGLILLLDEWFGIPHDVSVDATVVAVVTPIEFVLAATPSERGVLLAVVLLGVWLLSRIPLRYVARAGALVIGVLVILNVGAVLLISYKMLIAFATQ